MWFKKGPLFETSQKKTCSRNDGPKGFFQTNIPKGIPFLIQTKPHVCLVNMLDPGSEYAARWMKARWKLMVHSLSPQCWWVKFLSNSPKFHCLRTPWVAEKHCGRTGFFLDSELDDAGSVHRWGGADWPFIDLHNSWVSINGHVYKWVSIEKS